MIQIHCSEIEEEKSEAHKKPANFNFGRRKREKKMAHYQNEYGRTDEYGNPVRQQTDQYGNPIPLSHTRTDQYDDPVHQPATTGAYGTGTHTGYGTTTGNPIHQAGPGGAAYDTGTRTGNAPTTRTDEYGNPIHQLGKGGAYGTGTHTGYGTTTRTDEYGKPIRLPGTGGAYGTGTHNGYGTTTTAAGHHGAVPTTGTTFTTTGHHGKEHHGLGHGHDRHSSSSSSSEDEVDENGVRRKKKGMREKIKEKIPGIGGGHRDEQAMSTTTPTGGAYGYEEHHQKKGIMDKIKEKLPGNH